MNDLSKKVKENFEKILEVRFGADITAANERQIYQALLMSVNAVLAEKRANFSKKVKEQEAKQVYYMSMEFLVGTSLKNNLWNLGVEDEIKKYFKDKGFDIEDFYEMEPDAGLGNGGLGRLASCYMDSLTTLSYPVTGFSIRYEFGIFKQVIIDGWQNEFPDNWIDKAVYWLNERQDEEVEVHFFGNVHEYWTDEGLKTEHKDYVSILATPYDLFISGYDTDAVNSLRLWSAKSTSGFNMDLFSKGEYVKSTENEAIATSISKVLYPADDTYQGKSLRLKQQYFFVSASLQQITKKHYKKYGTFDNFAEKAVIHINDTHPSLCVPELMRILMDDYGYNWEKSWEITCSSIAYTNHTVMSEALEKWPVDLVKSHLPRIYTIIEEMNRRFCENAYKNHANSASNINNMSLIEGGMVKMANLSIAGSYSVNGVSKLHSQILKDDTFSDFYKISPEKFTNVTNGITHRRWLCQANPHLSELLSEKIGDGFKTDLEEISKFNDFVNDSSVLSALAEIKHKNKIRLSEYVSKKNGINLNTESLFDIQVKRLHEYKRQLLNALHIIDLYLRIKEDGLRPAPKTFIFAAKASSGYFMAKEIIRLICAISELIEKDPLVRDYIKVVFIADYKVSLAEIIIPAAEISEQISTAGKEASGTGNMKLMINGAVTLGTLDGANVEILDCVGRDNIFIFGMNANEVKNLWNSDYKSKRLYENNPRIRRAVDFIKGGFGVKNFDSIYNYLVNQDPYMVLADFESYCDAHERVNEAYGDKDRFLKMSLVNIANSGMFASDRSVKEYAKNIWHTNPVK
ncbi:MAG: glycogen/starch/alpha-glucan phosphorylase [Clostridia bacterium]|nr:glycogen/starch/alpha-glucan phosphorylase [Clostridia bacterium]